MGKIKIRGHRFAMPDVIRTVTYSTAETLWYFGAPKEDKEYVVCVGIGIVRVIEKGEEFDLVGMDFGRGWYREIYVKSNHARRQIYTLKKGQYAWFYGLMRLYTIGKKKKACFYAKAFQGWYVPKTMDIIKVDPNEIDKLTEENESKINFIDELLEKGGNDEK